MKALILTLIFLTTAPALAAEAAPKRVLMLISRGFFAPEYFEPRKAFEAAGYEIQVAAQYPEPVAADERHRKDYPLVQPELTFDEVDVSQFDAIVFSGGNGAWEDFFPNETVHRILTQSMKEKKVVALICSATGLLGVANNLDGEGEPIAKGKRVTGYKRVAGLLKKFGQVHYQPGIENQPLVVVDGNLITGRDPMSAKLFGQTIVKELSSL